MRYELVSLNVCPYVQRAVITLYEKQQPFDIKYIDPYQPPEWFLEWSPTGKVPVMRVDQQDILFESAVIMEYLEEVHPAPRFHPLDPLQKAKHRAWMEFTSQLFGNQYQLLATSDVAVFEEKQQALKNDLARIEAVMSGVYFGGDAPCLVDFAIAPFFTRLALIEKKLSLNLLAELPKIQALSSALLSRPSVQKSVLADFESIFYSRFKAMGGHAAQWL